MYFVGPFLWAWQHTNNNTNFYWEHSAYFTLTLRGGGVKKTKLLTFPSKKEGKFK